VERQCVRANGILAPWSTHGKNGMPHQVDVENGWRDQTVPDSASCRPDVVSGQESAGPQGVFQACDAIDKATSMITRLSV